MTLFGEDVSVLIRTEDLGKLKSKQKGSKFMVLDGNVEGKIPHGVSFPPHSLERKMS